MIWKIAVASMLLAGTSFGAAVLTGPTGDVMTGTTVTLSMQNDGTSAINGMDIFPRSPGAGKVVVAAWELVNPVLNTKINSVTAFTPGMDLMGLNDWGVKSASPSVGTMDSGDLVKLTLELAPGVTDNQVITFEAAWADTDFNEGEPSFVTFTLTPVPEPASMLLLAAGAAFFARRRRA